MKQTIEKLIANEIGKAEDGLSDALPMYCELKQIEKLVKECIKQIEEQAMDEFDRFGAKTTTIPGFEITKRNGYVTYDLNSNPDAARLKAEYDAVCKILKSASKMGKSIMDEDTGEVFEPCPVKSGAKDSLVIKVLADAS